MTTAMMHRRFVSLFACIINERIFLRDTASVLEMELGKAGKVGNRFDIFICSYTLECKIEITSMAR